MDPDVSLTWAPSKKVGPRLTFHLLMSLEMASGVISPISTSLMTGLFPNESPSLSADPNPQIPNPLAAQISIP